jgi:hypothetical protein
MQITAIGLSSLRFFRENAIIGRERGSVMAEFEMIREIFNQCSGNQMRDVFIEEIEADDPDVEIKKYLTGKDVSCTKTVMDKGRVVFDVTTDGMRQRFSFTPISAPG